MRVGFTTLTTTLQDVVGIVRVEIGTHVEYKPLCTANSSLSGNASVSGYGNSVNSSIYLSVRQSTRLRYVLFHAL
jgi:hypothetical protein